MTDNDEKLKPAPTALETKVTSGNDEYEKEHGPHSLGRHEAFHMACVLADMVERELVDHPAIQLRPDWQAIADAARIKLDELYQAIGKEA